MWRLNDRSLDLEESVVVTIDLSVSFEASVVVTNDYSPDLEESAVVTIDLSVSFEAGAVVA